MSDSRIETKFSHIPYDIIKIIKNHVIYFKIKMKSMIFKKFQRRKKQRHLNSFSIKNLFILNQVYMNMKC